LQDDTGLFADEHAAQLFLQARAVVVVHGVDEMGLLRGGADVAGDAEGLLDAVGGVPIGLFDLVSAEEA